MVDKLAGCYGLPGFAKLHWLRLYRVENTSEYKSVGDVSSNNNSISDGLSYCDLRVNAYVPCRSFWTLEPLQNTIGPTTSRMTFVINPWSG